jgi:hypothetical protein
MSLHGPDETDAKAAEQHVAASDFLFHVRRILTILGGDG